MESSPQKRQQKQQHQFMVKFPSPSKSPRSTVEKAAPVTQEVLDPSSPARDINTIVENAAKRFDAMDDDLKALLQDLKDYQASMKVMSENRLKTARHLESFATNSPFASNVRPTEKLVLEPRNKFVPVACRSASAVSMAVSNCSVEAVGEAEGTSSVASEDETSRNTDASTETDEHACKDIATPDLESFAGVHETASMLGDIYHKQFGDYLFHYVENWERTVSHRINGLLIHYRELQENAEHYQKKMVILHKKDKAKSAQHRLAEKLGRNEIKEMGAIEARDTVGEHLYLYIDEVIERAWRDVFPLLLRACRFEADFSAAEAKVLSSLIAVADTIQAIGEDEDCSVMGRLDDLQKKHPEEVYTFENPFLKLTPRKTKGKHPEDVSSKDSGSVSEEVSEDVESKAQKVAV